MRNALARTASASFVFLAVFSAYSLDFELSAGMTLDIAPFGIETAAPSLSLGLKLDRNLVLDPGLSVTGTLGRDVAELSFLLLADLTVCPGIAALSMGAGTVYHAGRWSEPGFLPYAMAGIRVSPGERLFVRFHATIMKKPDDLDSGLCALAGWRF